MNWRDFKHDPAGFKGFKGFMPISPPHLKPLEPLKTEELAEKCEAAAPCGQLPAGDQTEASELAAKILAIFTAKQPEIAGGGTSEKQILLDFAETARGENLADSHFAKSCNYSILDARHPGRRKILRPLSVYEYRLAAEAGRRAVFCENHRQQFGGNCPHFEIIEGWAPGDPAAALDCCLLWQKIRGGQRALPEQ